MNGFVGLCVLIWITRVSGSVFKPKDNLTDLSHCTVDYSQSGSVYKTFYDLADNLVEGNETLALDFHFAVLAPSDAHILLSPSDPVSKEDSVYEIVIGAGGNTFCDIRRKQKSDVKASVRVKDLLSALDPKFFWIHITKDGVIDVGQEGEELPFISWTDPDPLPLKYISFSTWSGIEAKWFFNCKWKQIEKVEESLTFTEKLRRDLLFYYDPYVRPVENTSTITTVAITLQINHVSLDEHQGSLELYGTTKLVWHDEKLRWDPADYGELDTLHIFRREIWQPDLVLLNAIGVVRDITQNTMMVAHSSGLVEWNPPVHMKVWCDGEGMGMWPSDKHSCNPVIAIIRDYPNIRLEFDRNESSLSYRDSSEWKIVEGGISLQNSPADVPIFEIVLTLQRNSNAYNTIFFTPFMFIAISVLASFWMSPLGKMKISVCCAQMIVTVILLLALAIISPKHPSHAPFLVSLYSYTLLALLFAIVISTVVINLCRNIKHTSLPHLLCRILTSNWMSTYFCLPKTEMPLSYGKMSDKTGDLQSMWYLLGLVIDRRCI
ncbi:unnamed protein product [Acanthoscelides obtectus]|uniref:Uncharacterized protein n=1 Tax=Acanthoscelides obtectus TaxID=200917 RepID=A0A9P0ME23_ACAOB|nr:unnamed protein product [Acanthoscelides obtectus]CAK1675713.1 Acetylcholine receptor subunit alpha-like 1 [Acanthoscelides obtectus]